MSLCDSWCAKPHVALVTVGLQEAQQEGPEEGAKATSARAEAVRALVKPKGAKPKVPKGNSCKLLRLACTAHPKLRKRAPARIAKGLRPCRPKAKANSQTKAAAPAAAPAQAQAQAPKDTQAPREAPE
ncbi:hypothetical protein CB1_000228026 [Camelus ferus]|nr:hypothetical protein CB1_000228026 [Camelus ferus]